MGLHLFTKMLMVLIAVIEITKSGSSFLSSAFRPLTPEALLCLASLSSSIFLSNDGPAKLY